ncbi:uncharacterized protein LOC123503367 isoform X2 [Portunus trituberculatus]|uniref:uncharacterized protein LOC123503367 isoform X2 n=1 Tax=Portunus trituberculatus TaxID=210409 RepID=UPI001E1D13B4|nr:uncharacterized protein LOC123503367 isoform X2 [Portunus trituberculatus]
MPLLKQAQSEGKIAYFRHIKLIIKERQGTRTLSGSSAASQLAISVASVGAGRMNGASAFAGGESLRSDASLGAGQVEGAVAVSEPLRSDASVGASRMDGDEGASADEPLHFSTLRGVKRVDSEAVVGGPHNIEVSPSTTTSAGPSTCAVDTDGEDNNVSVCTTDEHNIPKGEVVLEVLAGRYWS